MDYYQILGLTSRNATDADIQKAYRKLVKEWHPDKHRDATKQLAEKRFKEISEAYQVLSDEEKRKIYDKHGVEGLKQHEQMGGHSGNPFAHFQKMTMPNMQHQEEVELRDFYTGKMLQFYVMLTKSCDDCNATGCNDKSKITKCRQCSGNGKIVRQMPIAPGVPFMAQQVVPCNLCQAKGILFSSEHRCQKCNGIGKVKIRTQVDHYIKKGEDYGSRILEGLGEYQENGKRGALQLVLVPTKSERDKPLYQRRGANLVYELKLTLRQALLGFSMGIKHLDPNEPYLRLESSKPISPGSVKMIKGKGMPKKSSPELYGNLVIIFQIDFPTEIDWDTRSKLETCLPFMDGDKNSLISESENSERVSVDVALDYDEQESDEEEGGGPGMTQCVHQ